MRQINFSKRHPVVLFIQLLGAMLVTMWSMRPELILMSLVVSFLYALWLKGIREVFVTCMSGIFMLLFLVVILPLFRNQGGTPLFYINGRVVSRESVVYGLVMTALLVAVLFWFQVGNVWIDSEKMLYLSGRFFPALGLMISQVFRLLPLLRKRYREIHEGQKGLGLVSREASWLTRCRLLVRELSVLVSWSLEGTIETSMAMESRGYGTGRRTSFHLFSFRRRDAVCIALLVLLYGTTFVMQQQGVYGIYYFPQVVREPLGKKAMVGMLTFLTAMLLPLILSLAETGCGKKK